MKKIVLIVVVVAAILAGAFYILNNYIYNEKQPEVIADYKDATYLINGEWVTLTDGVSVTKSASDSATEITTRYFGNEVKIDLNNDGVRDVAFILTQETGGSGVFYYAVGAVVTELGYTGTEAYLLGDRIAPQTTEVSQNPQHKNVVVFNYADRGMDEPMVTPPSIGKSVYLKLVPDSVQWGIVEPDFEGESNL